MDFFEDFDVQSYGFKVYKFIGRVFLFLGLYYSGVDLSGGVVGFDSGRIMSIFCDKLETFRTCSRCRVVDCECFGISGW